MTSQAQSRIEAMHCPNCHQNNISMNVEVCPDCGVYLPSIMRDIVPQGTLLRQETYRIDGLLGRGGFGITYQAFHLKLAQPVAIKEFYPQELAVRDTNTGELKILFPHQEPYQKGLERFIREGRILATINHPHVVRVQDLFVERNTAYLVMELLPGPTLQQELKSQPQQKLSPTRIKQVMESLIAALTAVHEKGVYHLDIKPANVLSHDGRIVLSDFGAARQRVTSSSTQPYTPDYAAPEVVAGHEVGAESDIFELGMMLYEMLTGELPYPALRRLVKDTWQPQRLEEPWQSLVNSALQMQKSARPRSVKEWWEGKKKSSLWDSLKKSPNVQVEIDNPNQQPRNNRMTVIQNGNNPAINAVPNQISIPLYAPIYTSEKSVILIGDRAVGKTSMVLALARGTKHVKFTGDSEGLIAKRSNPATGEIAGTSTMTTENLSVNVHLPSGGRPIQLLWVDTPGEAFSSQNWRSNNQKDWQEIQKNILQAKALILLLSPHQGLVEPQLLAQQDFLDESNWLIVLEKWLQFFSNCNQVEHLLICLHKADMIRPEIHHGELHTVAQKWRFNNSINSFWFEYDRHIRSTYFAAANHLIKKYNSQNNKGFLRFFLTSIYQESLLELPWIYLATYLANK